ncbi:shikimate kinase [Winogradskyella aurantiaca]|uniref:shikimate kinase n=1 Tax=Winogradskyella aurantiaca TaxID=2219558 RepID=UPI000E1D877F|nr:shikimate kinase [Winogradskyella aurantiaca]
MKVVLIGYMGSGKTSVGQLLSDSLGLQFLDLDRIIEHKANMSIPDIFNKKGEIFFRKLEADALRETLDGNENFVLALGGGTPCYGANMDQITEYTTYSIYLKASIPSLVSRLSIEKDNRPLISHLATDEELTEFIGKHLFERQYYYNQSNVIVSTDGKSQEEVLQMLLNKLT